MTKQQMFIALTLLVFPLQACTGLKSVAFSPDGRTVLSGGGELVLWEVATGEMLHTFEANSSIIFSVAFSPDGQTILSGGVTRDSEDENSELRGELILWDATTGEMLHTFDELDSGILDVAFSPDGQTILSGGGELILWDATTGEILHTFEGHKPGIWGVAFSPDGQTILSGAGFGNWSGGDYVSSGGELLLWDVETGQVTQRFKADQYPVHRVAFSPDAQVILSGSCRDPEDLGSCRTILWDVATGEIADVLPNSR